MLGNTDSEFYNHVLKKEQHRVIRTFTNGVDTIYIGHYGQKSTFLESVIRT